MGWLVRKLITTSSAAAESGSLATVMSFVTVTLW